VHDKIIVTTQICSDIYASAVSTAVPPLHSFDSSAVIILQVCVQIGYVIGGGGGGTI
jgi:hypothetical protein